MKITKTASGKTEIRISKKEWEAIGKKAQWDDNDSRYDDSYLDEGPTSPHGSSIELFDPSTGEVKEVEVDIRFDVEPTEYEGSYVFYQGGVAINEIVTTEDAIINGNIYVSGTDVNNLIPFFADETTWGEYLQYVDQVVLSDVDIPKKHYPLTR